MTITVHGLPAPQGSKRFMGTRGGKGILIESSKAVKPWREAVKYAALDSLEHFALSVGRHCNGGFAGPVSVRMTFTLPKPKSAKRFAVPDKKPDLSKLIRSTEDALTDAGVWEDDSRVVSVAATKRYAGDEGALPVPGAVICVERAGGGSL